MTGMMFRAWDGHFMHKDVCVNSKSWSDCGGEHWFADTPMAVMMWSGRLDKNGEKIYDKDFLELNDKGFLEGVWEVRYEIDSLSWALHRISPPIAGRTDRLVMGLMPSRIETSEITGNVYARDALEKGEHYGEEPDR